MARAGLLGHGDEAQAWHGIGRHDEGAPVEAWRRGDEHEATRAPGWHDEHDEHDEATRHGHGHGDEHMGRHDDEGAPIAAGGSADAWAGAWHGAGVGSWWPAWCTMGRHGEGARGGRWWQAAAGQAWAPVLRAG